MHLIICIRDERMNDRAANEDTQEWMGKSSSCDSLACSTYKSPFEGNILRSTVNCKLYLYPPFAKRSERLRELPICKLGEMIDSSGSHYRRHHSLISLHDLWPESSLAKAFVECTESNYYQSNQHKFPFSHKLQNRELGRNHSLLSLTIRQDLGFPYASC